MKFREFTTSSGKKVLAGRNAENNERVIEQAEENEIVLHTEKPGSPFCNIKADKKEVSEKDIYEAGIFCASHSHDWRNNKKDVVVHVFSGKDIYKNKRMKTGTFGVKKFREIIAGKNHIKNFKNKDADN